MRSFVCPPMLLTAHRKTMANFKGIRGSIIVDCVLREISGDPCKISHPLALISIELNSLLKCVLSSQRIIKGNKLMKRVAIAFYCALVRTVACALFIERQWNWLDLFRRKKEPRVEFRVERRKKNRNIRTFWETRSSRSLKNTFFMFDLPSHSYTYIFECQTNFYIKNYSSVSTLYISRSANSFSSKLIIFRSNGTRNLSWSDSSYQTSRSLCFDKAL